MKTIFATEVSRTLRTLFSAVILVFVNSAVESLAASDAGKLEKREIVLAYPQASGVFTPIFVAGEAGLFKKYGLNVKLQQLNPQSSVQAVISGSADMSVAAGDLVNASMQGAKIKLVGSSMSQLVFQLWAAKEITSVTQLKGKTLAGTTPRSVLEIATREALKRARAVLRRRLSIDLCAERAGDPDRDHQRSSGGRRHVGADHRQSQGSRPQYARRYRQGQYSRIATRLRLQ